jgi:hypothetical protein
VGKVFADDVAAGGTKDIADEKNVHRMSLHGARAENFCSSTTLSAIKPPGDGAPAGGVW